MTPEEFQNWIGDSKIDTTIEFLSKSAISVTVSFTETKVRKKSEISKQKQNYFHTYFAD